MNRLVLFGGLYAATAALLKVAAFTVSLWVARTVPVEAYATWGLAYAIQTGITTFGVVGVLEAVIGLLRENTSALARGRLLSAATGVFLLTAGISAAGASLLLFAALFAGSTEMNGLMFSGAVISGTLLALASLRAQVVRLEEKHLLSLSFNFVVPFAGLLGSVAAFAAYGSVESFFIGSAVGLLLVVSSSQLRFRGRCKSADDRSMQRQILARLPPYVVVAFFGWLSGYGNNFVVNYLFEPADVARFTFALWIGSVMQLVASSMNQVWSPRFFRITQSQPFDVVENKNRRFFAAQALVLGALGGACMVVLPPLLKVLGGNLLDYASMRTELFFVLGAYIFLGPWSHCHNYLLANDRGASVMRIVLSTSAIGITLWLFLMWWLGPLGIYVGFFSQMVIRSVGIVLFARSIWPLRISWGGVAVGLLIVAGGLGLSTP